MNEIAKKIVSDATFDNDLLAETIKYISADGTINKEILAIVELGVTEKSEAPALFHQRNSVVVHGEGLITVCMDDVPNPKRGDKIIFNSKNFFVSNEYIRDDFGNQITLEVHLDSKAYKTL